jgi:chromosome segregation ATPase
MPEQGDLRAEYEKLSGEKERLEKALQETQVNFAAISAELEGNTESRMKAEQERDVLSQEAEQLRQALRKKMREIMIAAIAIIIPGCFAAYLYWLHDAGRGIREGKMVVASLTKDLHRYAKDVAVRDAELLKKDLELHGLLDRTKTLEQNVSGLEGRIRAAEAGRVQAVASLDKLKADIRRRELERSRSVRELQSDNIEAIKNLGEGSDQLEARVELLEKKIARMTIERGTIIPALIKALSHSDVRTRVGISRALAAATGKSYGTAQDRWEAWWKQHESEYQPPPKE